LLGTNHLNTKLPYKLNSKTGHGHTILVPNYLKACKEKTHWTPRNAPSHSKSNTIP